MAGRYQPYPSYKPSGLEWLGEIPADWRVLQSRRMFAQRKGRAQPDDEQLTSSQKYGIIYQKEFMKIENQRVVQVITGTEILKHVEANDFVISMRSFQGGLEWCKYPGSVSSAYIGLIPQKHVVPAFFSYLFKSKQYIQALQSTSNLVRDGQALRYENFSQVPLPIVSEEEQTKIAAFLDHETARIDALIAKQQRLIALLEEKRQAVISHAVTKGLNPNAPMRPSGIDWLGDVPGHWEVKRLKFMSSSIGTGSTPKEPDDLADEGAVPWFTPGDFDGQSGLTNAKKWLKAASIAKGNGKQFSRNSVLIVGIGATLGKIAVCELPFSSNQQINVATPNEKTDVHFLASALSSQLEQMKTVSNAATIGIMNQEKTGSIFIAVPPHNEQLRVANYLTNETSALTVINQKAQSTIALLKERRTALITAAVTGKIDVRDWQPPKSVSNPNLDNAEKAIA